MKYGKGINDSGNLVLVPGLMPYITNTKDICRDPVVKSLIRQEKRLIIRGEGRRVSGLGEIGYMAMKEKYAISNVQT